MLFVPGPFATMDLSAVDPTGALAPMFCLLLRCLFEVSDTPGTVLHTRFPGLGVGLLLYQFRSLVRVTACRDHAAQAFVEAIMRPDRLEQFLGMVFPLESFHVHAASLADMGPRGQPAAFCSALLLARINPDGIPHGCVVRGLRLNEKLVFSPRVLEADHDLLASEVRVIRRCISRAVQDRCLPLTCHLLFDRTPPSHAPRHGGPGAPVEVGTVDLEWENAGEDLDEPTALLIARMRPAMYWTSSRSTRYYNRHHCGWATTPPSSTDEESDGP